MVSNKDMKNLLKAVDLLKAISNPNRLAILCTLSDGELSVGELVEKIGLSQSALSQHLAKLRACGLVDTRREQQTIYYSLKSSEAEAIIDVLHKLYCRR
ncbi:MAG: ArsR family transcriptional regulator [Candidatus Dadabacteria bacterium]|nr:MAG: ArsR family transcriptional regulator [Candidatus Dadabacteria bacterium]